MVSHGTHVDKVLLPLTARFPNPMLSSVSFILVMIIDFIIPAGKDISKQTTAQRSHGRQGLDEYLNGAAAHPW